MRLSLLCLSMLALSLLGVSRAAQAMRPADPPELVRTMRASADHYRTVAWTYQHAAKVHTTPSSFAYRRSADPAFLQWTVARWRQHERTARLTALHALKRRLDLSLPSGPGPHASLARRIAYARTLTVRLRHIYPGRPARSLESAGSARQQLYAWETRAAQATLAVALHTTRLSLVGPRWLTDAFSCIHRYEGSWNENSGNGYYGGLQMDYGFMQRYGTAYLHRWGTADRWPAWAQIAVSVRAYRSGRGFWPCPNTARACGLL